MREDIVVRDVSWNLEQDAMRAIRDRVFVAEQGIDEDVVYDDNDLEATHFLVSAGDSAVACGRLQADGKVGRMAVIPEQRGLGLGRLLLDHIVGHAKDKGYLRLYLHAQSHATEFYQAAGFEPFGEEFEEAGIPHAAMELHIDYSGADSFITGVQYPEPFATLAIELAKTASRHLRIYSYRLDHNVFDSALLAAAMGELARRGRYSEIKILVSDARPMVQRGHRLLQLSRRLSSSISIRVLAEHPELPEATYVVRDTDGILYKPDDIGRPGFFEPNSRASAKKFIEGFDALWRWGERDPRLRQLTL